jgi:hypothetical protein
MTEPDVYENVHTGDVVLGGDGQAWGVKQIDHTPQGSAVTLVRHGQLVTGFPPRGTPVMVVSRAGVSEELRAFAALAESFGDVSLIQERWNKS